MEIIFKVVGSVFLVVIGLASMVAIYVGGETVFHSHNDKRGWAFIGGGVIGLILFLSIAVYVTPKGVDNSEHCGPGTEYRESRHYNPSTQSTHTYWWCETK